MNFSRILTLRRFSIALLGLCTSFVVLSYALSRPFVDFIVYWTAAHLFVSHQNPYSLPQAFQFQRALGWSGSVPLVFLCPPWVLTLIAPFGFANSYLMAWLIWLGILIAAVAISSRWIMDIYFGDLDIPEISHPRSYRFLFAFTFYPVLLGLKFVQLGPLMLLGLAGFLRFEERRPILAGLFLSLTLLKPQLLCLIWIAVILHSVRRRRWSTLICSFADILLFSAITLAVDQRAMREYWSLMIGPFPKIVLSGILGGVRSALQPYDTYWLQYLPPIGGMIWFAFYWQKHRQQWKWVDRAPALVTASVFTAAYSFTSDEMLLIIPVIFLAAESARGAGRLPARLVLVYTLLNLSVLAIAMRSTQWAVVPAPLVLTWLLHRGSQTPSSGAQLAIETHAG